MKKICTKCGIEQSVDCFYKDHRAKTGYQHHCKNCDSKYNKQYRKENKDKVALRGKKYREENREKIGIKDKQYRKENKELIIIKDKKYREANREKIAIKNKQYYEENKESISIKQKQWYGENKESRTDTIKQYRRENKDKVSLSGKQYRQTPMGKAVKANYAHKRRVLEKQGDVTTAELLQLTQNATHCFWCSISLKDTKPHIDHITPLSKGGQHTVSNLMVLCATCNIRKGTKDILEFAKIIFKEEIK